MTEPDFKVKILDAQEGMGGLELVIIPQGPTGRITIAITDENALYLEKKFQARRESR